MFFSCGGVAYTVLLRCAGDQAWVQSSVFLCYMTVFGVERVVGFVDERDWGDVE